MEDAALLGNVKLVKSILGDSKEKKQTSTFFLNAIVSRNLHLVKYLDNRYDFSLLVRELLRKAVYAGSYEIVKYFKDKYARAPDMTCLKPAAESGNLALVNHLINDLGCIPDDTTLAHAAQSGNTILVKHLIQTYHLLPNETTFINAIFSCHADMIDYFVSTYKFEIDPSYFDIIIGLPHDRPEIIDYILHQSPDYDRLTYLIIKAITLDKLNIVKYFCSHYSEIFKKVVDEKLSAATSLEMLKYLVERRGELSQTIIPTPAVKAALLDFANNGKSDMMQYLILKTRVQHNQSLLDREEKHSCHKQSEGSLYKKRA